MGQDTRPIWGRHGDKEGTFLAYALVALQGREISMKPRKILEQSCAPHPCVWLSLRIARGGHEFLMGPFKAYHLCCTYAGLFLLLDNILSCISGSRWSEFELGFSN